MSVRFCSPVSSCVFRSSLDNSASRQHLRSGAGHHLVIPSHRLTTYGRRAFSVAGPMFWNSLRRNLRDPSHTAAVFERSLKTFLFSEYWCTPKTLYKKQCIRGICDDALCKLMFYLLTYLLTLNYPKCPPYWNSASGFDFDHITAVDMSFCTSLRNFIQIGTLSA